MKEAEEVRANRLMLLAFRSLRSTSDRMSGLVLFSRYHEYLTEQDLFELEQGNSPRYLRGTLFLAKFRELAC